MITKIDNFLNSPIFTIIGMLFCICVVAFGMIGLSTSIAKKAVYEEYSEIYDKAYINGFRKARSYEIKDTATLNHLYPTYELMMKYEPSDSLD